jgi:acetylglutamate kinase
MTLPTPDAHQKAQTLIESLPWLLRFRGAVMVVKLGGNAMVSDDLLDAFASDMVYLRTVGVKPVVVHGGGPQISQALDAAGVNSEFRGGYRVTTTQAIPIVASVLVEQISADVVSRINQYGDVAEAVGGDGGLFTAQKATTVVDGETIDLGHVGEVTAVMPGRILSMLDEGKIPVVSSFVPGGSGNPGLNVNADQAAAALAVALGAEKLVLLTDVPGLYSRWPDTTDVISTITSTALRDMLPTLSSGMIPKMTSCLEAVDGGVSKAAIIDGRLAHSVLLEIFTPTGIGTEVISG